MQQKRFRNNFEAAFFFKTFKNCVGLLVDKDSFFEFFVNTSNNIKDFVKIKEQSFLTFSYQMQRMQRNLN